jgi:hypothetical protein
MLYTWQRLDATKRVNALYLTMEQQLLQRNPVGAEYGPDTNQ